MLRILSRILNWSEAWAVLIPLLALRKKTKKPHYLKPVIIYLWLAFVLNFAEDIIDNYANNLPQITFLINNNYLYNIHSIIRLLCFSLFFIFLKQPVYVPVKKYLPIIFFVFVIINFQFENFYGSDTISNRMFAVEAGILLFYCLQYYLFKLQDENVTDKQADFWVVMGLSVYVFFNFFFFLFYKELSSSDQAIGWNFHNISYIIFCIFIAKAFNAVNFSL